MTKPLRSITALLTLAVSFCYAHVSAISYVTPHIYTVGTVARAATVLSNNASLSALKLNPVSTLTSVTGPGSGNFTTTVPNSQTSVRVNATTSEAHATIKINGTTATSGAASQPIPLSIGDNVINVVVTAEDGTTVKNYIITATRPAVTLSNLTLSAGVLSPAFAATTASYTAAVPNATSSIKITPTVTEANSTVKVNGAAVTSGTASASISLAVGFNAITTVVAGSDGTNSQSYTVTVIRAAADPSADASLAGLQLNPNAALTAPGGPGSMNYTASIPNSQASFTVTATASQAQATIKINGTTVASGAASPAIALTVGASVAVTIVVTAQDGVTTKTYTVTVTRPSNNASLSGIQLTPISTLTSVSGPGNGNYTTAVINGQTSVKVNATTSEAHATIKVNGTAVASGTVSQAIPLSIGDNVINVVVTAQDGATVKNYIITVTRAAPSATLSNLELYPGVLSPAFATATTSYTSTVPYSWSYVNVTSTRNDANATIKVKVNGVTVRGYEIPVAVGANAIDVEITSSDGAQTQTYTITVTRVAANLSADAKLAGLQLNPDPTLTTAGEVGGTVLNLNFFVSATMPNSQTSFTITPTASEAHATIKINGIAIASGTTSSPFALAVGDNVNVIEVTAQDGVTHRTYTLTVTRSTADISTNASLSGLSLHPIFPLTTVTGPGSGNYTATVPYSQTYVTVIATASETQATITVNGKTAQSGLQSNAVLLSVGNNVINVVVTAPDGGTMKNYIITVTRAAGSMVAQYDGATADNLKTDAVIVHQGVSPNGDGDNDVLTIDGLTAYPDNSIAIMSRGGAMVFEAKGYNNTSVAFDGHSNKNGRLQQAGTYFYSLDYKDGDKTKRKTGFILLKY